MTLLNHLSAIANPSKAISSSSVSMNGGNSFTSAMSDDMLANGKGGKGGRGPKGGKGNVVVDIDNNVNVSI
ncbi:hypothetical protein CYY_007601 [Polysphondylium violaceum]|uniref:Uncharacterized protein n=1 Tax=Polysphondylium violaceum TaxID=133409 RepID=A0A8J4PNB2_9MYCE|nr:hypothetical protein CYY_007601 [Polysphondylium violaceum]